MNPFKQVFNCLVAIYCCVFVLYLFNLSTPPNNMPIFIVMVIVAVAALSFSRSKKKVGITLIMIIGALILVVKEHNDGAALKSKLEKVRLQSQQLDSFRKEDLTNDAKQ